MAFETIKSVRGRRSGGPSIRISRDYLYLNKSLVSTVKHRNVEIQVDKKTFQIRLVFKAKKTSSSQLITKSPYGGIIAFKGILELLGLKDPVTIDAQLEGKQATGTYKTTKTIRK